MTVIYVYVKNEQYFPVSRQYRTQILYASYLKRD
jgi:hypothetical protein